MRVNEYTSLNEFVYEYCQGKEFSWQNDEQKERYMGIEFSYNGTYYRMCREPYDEVSTPILKNGSPAMYDVMIMHCEKSGYPTADSFEVVGWYENLADVLENCILQGKRFEEIIMDDTTQILSKD